MPGIQDFRFESSDQSSDSRLAVHRPGFHEFRLDGGNSTPRRTIDTIAEQIVGLHDLVDLARAFVDHRALAISIEASDRVLVRVAVGAVNLHGVAGGALRGDGREPLGEAGLPRVALSLVLHPAGSQPEQPGRLIIRLHPARSFPSRAGAGRSRRRTCAALRVLHAASRQARIRPVAPAATVKRP